MATVRERLAALARPLSITLPEEYLTYMENGSPPGILISHLCNPGEERYEWLPETMDGLEDPIDRYASNPIPFAHYVRETADQYREGGVDAIGGPGGMKISLDRLRNGFWIGEVDGDSVFLDQETLAVMAFLQHEDAIEIWADSFAAFLEHGQQ